jgi:hypothetical protein
MYDDDWFYLIAGAMWLGFIAYVIHEMGRVLG